MVAKFRYFAVFLLFIAIILFYFPTLKSFINGKILLPIPADTIVGLYHPFRDLYANDYPNGIPFKNFLVTDPVRQTYPWKELTIDIFKKFQIPTWNPYEMSGKPLMANFQSGVFYPFNFMLFLGPFEMSWSFFIILQTILCAVFTYFYIRNLKVTVNSSVIGSLAFTFSSFCISWLEWGNIVHTALWLPLVLLAIDKLLKVKESYKFKINIPKKFIWAIIYIFSIASSFLAGHLQVFFYIYITSFAYLIFRLFTSKSKNYRKIFAIVLSSNIIFILITSFQWISTLNFINNSARISDQNFISTEGWFIPYRQLVQFLIPDFFGNPSTLNYWGDWNYGELTGYIGVIPILLVGYSFFSRNKSSLFFICVSLFSLLFSLPNFVSKIPFLLEIPFISSAQPTRLMVLIVFSLSVLAAFGHESLLKIEKNKFKYLLPITVFLILFLGIWTAVYFFPNLVADPSSRMVTQRNLFFPTAVFIAGSIFIVVRIMARKNYIKNFLIILLITVSIMDLLRFSQKFTSFSSKELIFPNTKIIQYLKSDRDVFRVGVTDRRIMPPNFFTHYRIHTIEGYDPLFIKDYAEFITVLESGKTDAVEPFGFNRIITPHNIDSPLYDFLNVKYVMTFDELKQPKYTKVLEEGTTKLYKNNNFLPRVYFITNLIKTNNVFSELLDSNITDTAIVEDEKFMVQKFNPGKAKIVDYQENHLKIETVNDGDGFLVLSDAYYPTWTVFIDGNKSRIMKVNNAFRGVVVPSGSHEVLFKNTIL